MAISFALAILLLARTEPPSQALVDRDVISLNGNWEVGAGVVDADRPDSFPAKVPVPGLVDLAQPPLSSEAKAYFYRRTFTLNDQRPVNRLRLRKAMYAKTIFVNGQKVGTHEGNFTRSEFEITPFLRGPGQLNEIVVRLGRKEDLPKNSLGGNDYEKTAYIPGIYDDVELVRSGNPCLAWIQVRPMPAEQKVGVLALITGKGAKQEGLSVQVRLTDLEGRVLSQTSGTPNPTEDKAKSESTLYVELDAKALEQWSPENPKLYRIEVQTPGDSESAIFGQRSYGFPKPSGASTLNGSVYPLRGTNICIHRFFEDKHRARLPWNESWVRKMFQEFKSLGWNAVRFSLGFPPELWYRVADEEGILIQDEFPIWQIVDFPKEIEVSTLATQYAEWMTERWNHPSVVIWDGSNETPYVSTTGFAIQAVRKFDLSNRPWDNGASGIPDDDFNPWECHPYFLTEKPTYTMQDLNDRLSRPPAPMNGLPFDIEPYVKGHPRFVNEFDWLWLNRDGSCVEATQSTYDRFLGQGHKVEDRYFMRAVQTASKTELWRFNEFTVKTGVLQFCALGYSRGAGKGITSDFWQEPISELKIDPYFRKFVGDANSRIGMIISKWWENGPAVTPGSVVTVPIRIKNDTEKPWKGTVKVSIRSGSKTFRPGDWKVIQSTERSVEVDPFAGVTAFESTLTMPKQPGDYWIVAEYSQGPKTTHCIRSITVK